MAVPKRRAITKATAKPAVAKAATSPASRIDVRKTYKLYIGGEFPRTESGRAYEVFDARGRPLANACRGTRKDIRDAVRAARTAFPGWAARTCSSPDCSRTATRFRWRRCVRSSCTAAPVVT